MNGSSSYINQMPFVQPIYHPPPPRNYPKGQLTTITQKIPVTTMKTHYIEHNIPVLKVQANPSWMAESSFAPSSWSSFSG